LKGITVNISEDPQFLNKPGKVQAIAIMTLISGILNIIWTFGLFITILVEGLASFGIGCLCFPIMLLPLITAVFEIDASIKLLGNPPRKANVQNVAIFQIINILSLSFTSLIFGILNLVFSNEPEVKNYLNALNP